MEIQLSKTLRALRQKNGKTQDDLALFLGISSQAVSKWERNEGFPDITHLPKIAGYFHISVDELLGVDRIAKQNRINEIYEEYKKIHHHMASDPNHRLDEGIKLLRKALVEVPGEFLFERFLADNLAWKGMHTSDTSEKKKLFEEATFLCEDILSRSTEERWRDSAKRTLLMIYGNLGMTDKALELANQMPHPTCTRENMLTYVLKGEALQEQRRYNAVLYYELFRESILHLSESDLDPENMLHEKKLTYHAIETEEYLAAIENVLSHKE